MNKQLRRLGIGMLAMYAVLFAQLNRVQIFDADRYLDDPSNTRAIVRNFDQTRGTISTRDGVVIAQTIELGDEASFDFQREYPHGGTYGHLTGFFSFNYGATGVEREYNDYLAGERTELQFQTLSDLFVEEDPSADVALTIRHDVQTVAEAELDGRRGSVVALDPRTGAVLAAFSNPGYDPNWLSTVDIPAATEAWETLTELDSNPMLPRFYREIFFPGSTFKVVTAAAGLETGAITASTPVYPVLDAYTPPLTSRPLRNFGGSSCGGDLIESLRVSCNTAFAEMAAEDLGPEPMVSTAEAFGFNQEVPIDLPVPATSRFPTDFGERRGTIDAFYAEQAPPSSGSTSTSPPPSDPVYVYDNTPALAQSAIGQNDVAATPLQMAMVAAAVANNGEVMAPHVLYEITNRSGEEVEGEPIERWRTAMRPSVAATLREAMVEVATSGTAQGLQIPGFTVGGKTGTAQLGTPEPQSHAWIIGFAGPPGAPAEVAVAVLVEAQPGASEQTGGRVAAPIARAVLEAALAPLAVVEGDEPS